MFSHKYYSSFMAPSPKQNRSLTLFELFYFSIAEAVEDMEAFTKLTDDIFQIILYSPAGGKVLLSSNLQEIDEDSRQQTSSDSRSGE